MKKDRKNPDERWAMQKAKLKLQYSHLHEDDFQFDYGKKDVMLEQLQAKLGLTREELNAVLLAI